MCVHVFSVFVRALTFQLVVLYLKEYLDHYIIILRALISTTLLSDEHCDYNKSVQDML